ncbi:MAG: hypothetical protein KGL39_17200 [Patescibacteria group bacterium]|nr:hypothetical protein [Patescibacteria group bacterium]
MTLCGKLHCALNPRYWHFRLTIYRENLLFEKHLHYTQSLLFIIGPFYGWLGIKGPELYNGFLEASSRRALISQETIDAYKLLLDNFKGVQ